VREKRREDKRKMREGGEKEKMDRNRKREEKETLQGKVRDRGGEMEEQLDRSGEEGERVGNLGKSGDCRVDRGDQGIRMDAVYLYHPYHDGTRDK
jgi:hypothetical protein